MQCHDLWRIECAMRRMIFWGTPRDMKNHIVFYDCIFGEFSIGGGGGRGAVGRFDV